MPYDDKLDEAIISSRLLQDNAEFLGELREYLEQPIENENCSILRNEIAQAYNYMTPLIKLKARAEAIYRLSQKDAATRASLRGTGRDSEINGFTAQYRYARDLLEGCLDTLNSKLSASKAILSSLDNELRRLPGD